VFVDQFASSPLLLFAERRPSQLEHEFVRNMDNDRHDNDVDEEFVKRQRELEKVLAFKEVNLLGVTTSFEFKCVAGRSIFHTATEARATNNSASVSIKGHQ
jgi:hypothetical protein